MGFEFMCICMFNQVGIELVEYYFLDFMLEYKTTWKENFKLQRPCEYVEF